MRFLCKRAHFSFFKTEKLRFLKSVVKAETVQENNTKNATAESENESENGKSISRPKSENTFLSCHKNAKMIPTPANEFEKIKETKIKLTNLGEWRLIFEWEENSLSKNAVSRLFK